MIHIILSNKLLITYTATTHKYNSFMSYFSKELKEGLMLSSFSGRRIYE